MSITWKFNESENNVWNDDRQESLIGFIEDLSKWYEDGFTGLGEISIFGKSLDIANEGNRNKWLDKLKDRDAVRRIEIDIDFEEYNKGWWQEELEGLISSILGDDKKAGYKFLYESSGFWTCTHRIDGGFCTWSKDEFSEEVECSGWIYDDEDDA